VPVGLVVRVCVGEALALVGGALLDAGAVLGACVVLGVLLGVDEAVALALAELLSTSLAFVAGATDIEITCSGVVCVATVVTTVLLVDPLELFPPVPKTRKPTTAMPAQPPVTISPSPRRLAVRPLRCSPFAA
jgi:hypothetical protein